MSIHSRRVCSYKPVCVRCCRSESEKGGALPGTPSPSDSRELVEAQENYKVVFASGMEANAEQRAKALRAIELAAERCEMVGYTALARQIRPWMRTQ
jgi:hypothetical protein